MVHVDTVGLVARVQKWTKIRSKKNYDELDENHLDIPICFLCLFAIRMN